MDRFGPVGADKQPLLYRIWLYSSAAVLLPVRGIALLLVLLTTWAFCGLCAALPARAGCWLVGAGCRMLARIAAFWSGLLWIQYSVEGPRPTLADRNATPLIIAPHCSWLDILLVSCLYVPSYVSKVSACALAASHSAHALTRSLAGGGQEGSAGGLHRHRRAQPVCGPAPREGRGGRQGA